MILNNYFWTDESIERNKITEKYEICQSAVFFMFLRDFSCEYVLDIGANIGYYSLLSALDCGVKKIVSASLKLIVDNNLEKFPTALKSHLDCNIEIESNVLHVNVNSDKLKHIMDLSKTEYAFYLLINGKICQKFPYIECSKFSINLKEYQDKISGNNLAVRVFVREKNNYAKKLNKVFRIKS
ncbi:hypothetical protein [Helicobacter pullorum]|uniref:hypothetical protein n=1 Tax=Helicobacter pullorum TaxID=35818 RepID=UPI0006BB0DF7|nr:hypothetical protein [Helicobacter pullorum]KPH53620.1 hypothetical protein HPU229313_00895 [Helicobacter pullorum]